MMQEIPNDAPRCDDPGLLDAAKSVDAGVGGQVLDAVADADEALTASNLDDLSAQTTGAVAFDDDAEGAAARSAAPEAKKADAAGISFGDAQAFPYPPFNPDEEAQQKSAPSLGSEVDVEVVQDKVEADAEVVEAAQPPANHMDSDYTPAVPLDPPQEPSESQAATPHTRASKDPSAPLSMAQLFAASSAGVPRPTRVYVATIVGFGVFVASCAAYSALSSLRMPALPTARQDVLSQVPKPSQRDAWLRELRTAKAPNEDAKLLGLNAVSVSAPDAAAPHMHRAGRRGAGAGDRADQMRPSDVDPVFSAYFGSAQKFRSANRHPSSAQPVQASEGANAGLQVQGTVLGARLQDDISSDPTGSPVIAVLLRSVTLHGVRLPVGSEVHGTVSGHNDTRIFVAFQFLRTAAGEVYSLTGLARDVRGRAGIPGVKRFTRRTAASIGVSSAARMMQQVGREFAGSAGAVLGAGIEVGATETAEKSKRADQDEYVVTVQAGAPLSIYVQTMSTGFVP